MLGIRTRRPPPFGGIHIDDDKDIQVQKPEEASRNNLWAEGRLLLRDLVFALMIAALAPAMGAALKAKCGSTYAKQSSACSTTQPSPTWRGGTAPFNPPARGT